MATALRFPLLIAAASVAIATSSFAASTGTSGRPTPQMQSVLDELQALGAKPVETLTPAEARKQPSPADAVVAVLKKQGKNTAPEAVAKVENRTVPVNGGQVPVRIYRPSSAANLPVVLYIHGGGWVIADLDTYDGSARALTNAAKAIVVSTHYRQGPEHKFPTAHDDTYAVYKWLLAHAEDLGGNARALAIAGESAGGNMAASIAYRAGLDKVQAPVHLVLIYPVAQAGMETDSYKENVAAKPLSTGALAWFTKHYFDTPADGQDPKFNLLKADLKGLPGTTLLTAQIDPLRSEGKLLADRLQAAGVKVNYKNYDGVAHEFFGMGAVVPEGKAAVALAGRDLAAAFESRQ